MTPAFDYSRVVDPATEAARSEYQVAHLTTISVYKTQQPSLKLNELDVLKQHLDRIEARFTRYVRPDPTRFMAHAVQRYLEGMSN